MKIAPSLVCVALACLLASVVHADAPELQAELVCQKVPGPGRVLCELTSHVAGARLVWSDALVVRAPSFARPLRSRVLAELGGAAAPGVARAKLALVASAVGQGKLEVLARGVVCRGGSAGESCSTRTVTVTALVSAGDAALPAP